MTKSDPTISENHAVTEKLAFRPKLGKPNPLRAWVHRGYNTFRDTGLNHEVAGFLRLETRMDEINLRLDAELPPLEIEICLCNWSGCKPVLRSADTSQ